MRDGMKQFHILSSDEDIELRRDPAAGKRETNRGVDVDGALCLYGEYRTVCGPSYELTLCQ